MKGVLVYKDVSGNVWGIIPVESEFRGYVLSDPDTTQFTEESIEQVLSEIDRGPEWLTQSPSEPIQQDQLDRGAFPNEGD